MANLKGSDNAFPSILIEEATEPTAPAAGHQRLYIDSTTHVLMVTNSSGTQSPVSSGAVATDAIWDAAGDLAVGSGANTASKLTKGSDGTILTMTAGAVGWASPAASAVPSAYGCRVYRDTSDQSLGNNTFTAIQFNQEVFDTSTMHDNSTNNTRITIPSISGVTTGLWRFMAKGYTSATALRADVKLRKGGSTDYDVFIGTTGPSGAFPFFGTWTIVCTAADYFEAMARTTSGTFNVVATDSTSQPFFSAEFLGKVS